jgi:hypothetical protein
MTFFYRSGVDRPEADINLTLVEPSASCWYLYNGLFQKNDLFWKKLQGSPGQKCVVENDRRNRPAHIISCDDQSHKKKAAH